MMAIKQPYIPLYIGDWKKDTDTISLEAEAALLRLIFKLWDSPTKGEGEFSLNQLALLLKKGEEITVQILEELQQNNTLDIQFLEKKGVKIKSRRMLKDLAKSKSASDRGKKGSLVKKRKNLADVLPQFSLSQTQANSDIDNDNSINNNISVIESFFSDLPNSTNFEAIAKQLFLTKDQLKAFIPEFIKKAEVSYPSFDRFCNHFKNWVAIELRKQQAPIVKLKTNYKI